MEVKQKIVRLLSKMYTLFLQKYNITFGNKSQIEVQTASNQNVNDINCT